jgi:hypothetical protein
MMVFEPMTKRIGTLESATGGGAPDNGAVGDSGGDIGEKGTCISDDAGSTNVHLPSTSNHPRLQLLIQLPKHPEYVTMMSGIQSSYSRKHRTDTAAVGAGQSSATNRMVAARRVAREAVQGGANMLISLGTFSGR